MKFQWISMEKKSPLNEMKKSPLLKKVTLPEIGKKRKRKKK
jgi:hypothetical protein